MRQRLLNPSGLMVLLGAAFLFKVWSAPGIIYSGHSDLIAIGTGLQALEQRSLKTEGRWPLWNPAANAGSPAHADPTANYSWPVQWLTPLLPLDAGPAVIALLNLLLAGLAMQACARRFLQESSAAFFCGAAYMLSYRALVMMDTGWVAPLAMYALTPLVVWAFDRFIEHPGPARAWQLALALGLAAMQGFPQTFYYLLLGLMGFLAWRLRGLSAREIGRILPAFAGAAVLGAMLAAPDLLPRFEFASLSTRMQPDYAFFLSDAPSWSSLKTFFDPGDAGGARPEYWENNFYFGLWLYPLMLLACLKDWKKSRGLFACLALCILLSFDGPVLKLFFHYLPGFDLFRRSARLLLPAQFVAVLLAGIGADFLLRGPFKRRGLLAAALLCAPVLLDSGLRVLPRLDSKPLSEAFPAPPFAAELARSENNGRTAALSRTAVAYGLAAYYGIDLINGYAPLNLRHYVEYFSVLRDGHARNTPRTPVVWTDLTTIARPDMLRALDVRNIVGNQPVPLEKIGYDLAGRLKDVPVYKFYTGIVGAPMFLWRDRSPLGPAYFARSARAVESPQESLQNLVDASVLDARVFGWEEGGVPLDFSGGRARMTHRGYNLYRYEVESSGQNFLILSQVWYPGWRARVDGQPTRLYRTNHALLGCVVGPGRHTLELEMTSPPLRVGLILCAAALVVIVFLGLVGSGLPQFFPKPK